MAHPGHFTVSWVGTGKRAQCPSNLDFPDGKAVDLSVAGKPSCETTLPYPAAEIGYHRVECRICGLSLGITAAGRPDDPCSVVVACRPMARA